MSNATNYTINSFAAQLYFQKKLENCMLYNSSSTATVYVDKYPGVTPSSGFPVPPLSTKIWSSGDDLYAISDSTAILNVSDNAGDVANPQAIATSLITSGLAGAIAAAITLSGVPVIDNLATLDNPTFTGSYVGPVVDTSRYQSVNVLVYKGTPASVGQIEIKWFDSTGALFLGHDVGYWSDGTPGTPVAIYGVPVRGAKMQVNFTPVNPLSAGIVAVVYASYKVLPKANFRTYGSGIAFGGTGGTSEGGAQDWGYMTWSGTVPISTTWEWHPDVIAGPAQLTTRFVTASANVSPIALYNNGGFALGLSTIYNEVGLTPANGFTENTQLLLPPVGLIYRIVNNSATVPAAFRITLTFGTPFS